MDLETESKKPQAQEACKKSLSKKQKRRSGKILLISFKPKRATKR